MTRLRLAEFDALLDDVCHVLEPWSTEWLTLCGTPAGDWRGHPFELTPRDPVLLTVVWLRRYPIHEVLGFLFEVSDSTVCRYIGRVLPVLEAAGRITMRLPDPEP